ncbi:MAG TPA: GAF domain-containing protein, partial [Herpetosiphonaceae bacterium]
ALAAAAARREQRNDQRILLSLHHITAVSATAESLEPILETIYQETVDLMGVTGFVAVLYEPHTNSLCFPLRYDRGERFGETRIPFDPEQSVTAWMIANRQSILRRDTLVEPFPVNIQIFGDGATPRSWLGVPMIAQGEVIGALSLQSYEPNVFDEDDERLLTQISQQAAVAILNHQGRAAYQQRLKELTTFNDLSKELSAHVADTPLPDLLEAIRVSLGALLDTDHFYIALCNETKQHITFPLATEHGERKAWRDRQSGPYLSEHVLAEGRPVRINGDIPAYMERNGMQSMGTPAAAWLGAPIWMRGKAVGVMAVQAFEEGVTYSEEDERLLVAAAAQAAGAIQISAMLTEEQRQRREMAEANQRQAQLLEMIREISTPVIPILAGVLVVPMVGTIDSSRATQIIDSLLAQVAALRAQVVLLDITGVPIVDTGVANYLLQAIRATQLLGAQCVVVGIRPEVAQTIVGLGVDLGQVATLADLQEGVRYALGLRGLKVVPRS